MFLYSPEDDREIEDESISFQVFTAPKRTVGTYVAYLKKTYFFRPDISVVVDWALKTNDLSIYHS